VHETRVVFFAARGLRYQR